MAIADDAATVETFYDLVNMTPKALETWLASDESRAVGQKTSAQSESTGHHAGRDLVALLHKKKRDFSDEDYAFMHRVVGYIKRHLAQRPPGDVEHTPWAHSLKNWGHDPSRSERP